MFVKEKLKGINQRMDVRGQTETARGIIEDGHNISNGGSVIGSHHIVNWRAQEKRHVRGWYIWGIPHCVKGQGGHHGAMGKATRTDGED